MIRILAISLFFVFAFKANACSIAESSIVYFKLFNTQTMVPITKKNFHGVKMVIKNNYFKKILDSSKKKSSVEFFENIRMTVNYANHIYYLNQQGDIELNDLVIGKLDKKTRDHLDLGYDLYEWGTCRSMNEVLEKMLEEHNKHVEKLFKEQILHKNP
jgi:hypothetical protein